MPSIWYYPNLISQYCESDNHVSWVIEDQYNSLKSQNGKYLRTIKPLLHISNFSVNDLKMKTWYLICKDFNFDTFTNLNGIEMNIFMKRGGRITDETVQLYYDNNPIGKNLANSDLSMDKTFGGENILWGLTSDQIVLDNNFGIILRFQSHPSFPHRETPMIDYVRLRLW